ncbi:coatomer subunit delta [Polyrhizophydium stewartii]|uniref:Coatomer subunit delta n=1 Tax=Polyrhizophydium stewartii TaxID=2732419 RepID=A0ABR4NCX5_9FUNG
MSRSRIEGLIASFPKLIGASDQHTYVETDAVRYVYQPLDNLFMVLVTTKNSNILQDIDTLHLFARVVSEYCRSNDEREIAKHAFDLVLVFDEVISLGYRENINLAQIRTISVMESHEERVQAEIEKNKEKEAKEELKRKARMIDQQKRESAKRGFSGGMPGSGGYGGFGAGGGSGFSGNSFSSGGVGGGAGSGFGPSSGAGSFGQSQAPAAPSANSFGKLAAPASGSPMALGRGLQLGGGQRQNNLLATITADEGIQAPAAPAGLGTASNTSPAAAVASAREESVHIAVEEKISVTTSRDGSLQALEINGSMMLKINDPSTARVRLAVSHLNDPNVRFTTHPNIDKALWASESVIALRDPSRPFPVGQAIGILRWKVSTRSESLAPLLINCWPSPTGAGACDVNIEYELQNTALELHNVEITIPYPGGTPPTVGDIEGHYKIDRQKRAIQWSLPLIDASNASGMLEFNVQSEDVDGFYPIQIQFSSSRLLNPIQARGAEDKHRGPPFSIDQTLKADIYQVV